MGGWVHKALTRKIHRKGPRGKQEDIVLEPNQMIVLLVKFALGMALCLSGLEIAYLVVMGTWSSEVFAAITGLIGTVTGVLIGHHA
jgi:hypothetical protein